MYSGEVIIVIILYNLNVVILYKNLIEFLEYFVKCLVVDNVFLVFIIIFIIYVIFY